MDIKDNKLRINGKETILTDKQMKELGFKESKENPFDIRLKDDELYDCYCYITEEGDLGCNDIDNKTLSHEDIALINVANACMDKDLMQQRAWHETLNRLLWRFAEENNEPIDWKDSTTHRWCIRCFIQTNIIRVESFTTFNIQGTIYFSSNKLAQRAIDEIVKPFMEEHPDFKW